METARINQLKRKHWPQDIDFYAKSMIKNRFDLMVDTAGGMHLSGSFPTHEDAIDYYFKHHKDKEFKIYDSFNRIPKSILKDRLEYLKLIGVEYKHD